MVIWDIGQVSKGTVVSEILTIISVVIGKFWAFFGLGFGTLSYLQSKGEIRIN